MFKLTTEARRALLSLLAVSAMTSGCGETPTKESSEAPSTPPAADTDVISATEGTASTNGAFTVKVVWAEEPRDGRYLAARLVFGDGAKAQPRTVEGVKVVLWMREDGMDHPSHDKEQALAPRPGHVESYDASGLYFTMEGNWDVEIEATVNGVADRAVVPVTVR